MEDTEAREADGLGEDGEEYEPPTYEELAERRFARGLLREYRKWREAGRPEKR